VKVPLHTAKPLFPGSNPGAASAKPLFPGSNPGAASNDFKGLASLANSFSIFG
jgi:hypothetical protein